MTDGQRTYGAWGDESGPIPFARVAKEAPVIHFGGPLRMGFEVAQPLVRRGKGSYELMAAVGTKGSGPGTFAHLKYWNGAIPERPRPTAILEFPARSPGGHRVRVEAVLKERC